MKIQTLKGNEIVPYIHSIAELRIKIFREYPYFYEGNMSFEEKYLRMYLESDDCIFIIAKDDDGQVVGAVTGISLEKSMKEIKQGFCDQEISTEGIFYLGEILLYKEYKRKGIGYTMYTQFEKVVRDTGIYKKIALCEIDKPENDVKKPIDYISLNSFWNRQCFVKYHNIRAYFSYQEIGFTEETTHPMVFWIKDLYQSSN